MAAMPTVPVSGVQSSPLTGGLYDAVTPTDLPDSRIIGGLSLEQVNTGTAGRWPTEIPAPDGTPDKTGTRPDRLDYDATIVWAADAVKSVGTTIEGARQRAEHQLRLLESVQVEEFVAQQLIDSTPSAGSATKIEEQLEVVEDTLGRYGRPGVVHARRGLIAHFNGLIVRQGQALYTPGGHRWVFGAGYDALGDSLYVTGPMVIQRSPVEVRDAFDRKTNERAAIAERVVAVGWESPTVGVPRTPAT